MFVLEDQMIYDIQPKLTPPYNSGKISKETLDNSMKYLNSLRFAAGLSYDIGLTDEYLKLAQNASLLCQVNNLLQHSDQPKPKIWIKNYSNQVIEDVTNPILVKDILVLIIQYLVGFLIKIQEISIEWAIDDRY